MSGRHDCVSGRRTAVYGIYLMTWNTFAENRNSPFKGIELVADEVHVWRASLDQDAATVSGLATLLAPDERRRGEKYYRALDRDRFVAARGILRKIISNYLPTSPGRLPFNYNEGGKPYISDGQNTHNLNFNLSHANGLALYAVTRGHGVGIDIEYIREDFVTYDGRILTLTTTHPDPFRLIGIQTANNSRS